MNGEIHRYEKNPNEKIEFVSNGKLGGCLYVKGEHNVENTTFDFIVIPITNLTTEAGTIDFYFKPDNWDSEDECAIHYLICNLDSVNEYRYYNTTNANRFFIEFSYHGDYNRFIYNLSKYTENYSRYWGVYEYSPAYPSHFSFTNGQWLHFRFTWSKDKKILGQYSHVLFVNGNPLIKAKADIDGIYNFKKYLCIGSVGTHFWGKDDPNIGNMYQNACGYIDELYVYTNLLD